MNILELILFKSVLFLVGPAYGGPLFKASRFVRQTVEVSDDEMLLREICQIGDGEYRHPYSCTRYLQCNGGMYTEKDCPFNMVYDVQIRSCNYKRKIKCSIISGLTDFGDGVWTTVAPLRQPSDGPTENAQEGTAVHVSLLQSAPVATASKNAPKKANSPEALIKSINQPEKQTLPSSTVGTVHLRQPKPMATPEKEEDCVIWEDE